MSIFGTDDKERKACPVLDGAIMYFPRALAAIARHSLKSNEKHNPGEPLHWAKHKSTDHFNTALRHIIDFKMGAVSDGEYDNLAAAAWRVLAALEIEMERRDQACAVVKKQAAITRAILDQRPEWDDRIKHAVPEGYNWLPSDNCSCRTCREWKNPVAATLDPLEETQSLFFHSEHCYLDCDHIGPCPEGPTMSLDDLNDRS